MIFKPSIHLGIPPDFKKVIGWQQQNFWNLKKSPYHCLFQVVNWIFAISKSTLSQVDNNVLPEMWHKLISGIQWQVTYEDQVLHDMRSPLFIVITDIKPTLM